MDELSLRERKKRKTRAAIQAAGLRLFAEQGYVATTCDQIAAAAEVSPATFYRYFPTKEDIVLSDDYDRLVFELFAERRPGETLIGTVRCALAGGFAAAYEHDASVIDERLRLALTEPALRARIQDERRVAETMLAEQLAPRMGATPAAYRVRVVASAIVAALYVAMEEWATGAGSRDLMLLSDEALAALETAIVCDPEA
ncbi:MAG: TetR family transcriptional regulator [Chloroflexi bacterium]|nr:TetR family transcriptional regulator [Chloroflexota bacterium]